jgi:hypothetical protein
MNYDKVLNNIKKYDLEIYIRINFKGCLKEFGLQEDEDIFRNKITFNFIEEPVEINQKGLKDVKYVKELFNMSISEINELIVRDNSKKMRLSQ